MSAVAANASQPDALAAIRQAAVGMKVSQVDADYHAGNVAQALAGMPFEIVNRDEVTPLTTTVRLRCGGGHDVDLTIDDTHSIVVLTGGPRGQRVHDLDDAIRAGVAVQIAAYLRV